MNILIIGNGFDLAHGLPTKYEHFLEYIDAFKRYKYLCQQENAESIHDAANIAGTKFIVHFANLYKQNKRIFEEIDELVSNNIWINYFEEIYKKRKMITKDGWIDFECEISRIIQTLDKARHTILEEIKQGRKTGRMTQQQLNILSPLWGKSVISRDSIQFNEDAIENEKVNFLTNLNKLTRCLEIYLYNYVENITPKVKLPYIDKLDIDCVLSFNYTHTYEKVYHTDKGKRIAYDYIHGEVKSHSTIEKCNLILGIDEYLDEYARDRENEFIQFKKFYQRIYKKTGCKYVDWKKIVEKISPDNEENNATLLNNIYIVGHSLDITDKDILSSLINMVNTKTTIFYHSQEALGNQISNLVKILGEDELISKVHGSNASIVFKKQQKPVMTSHTKQGTYRDYFGPMKTRKPI